MPCPKKALPCFLGEGWVGPAAKVIQKSGILLLWLQISSIHSKLNNQLTGLRSGLPLLAAILCLIICFPFILYGILRIIFLASWLYEGNARNNGAPRIAGNAEKNTHYHAPQTRCRCLGFVAGFGGLSEKERPPGYCGNALRLPGFS